MATSQVEQRPACHVLNFFFDNEDSSALTALINSVRFHIIVDAARIRIAGKEELLTEYLLLLEDARNAAVKEEARPQSTTTSTKSAEATVSDVKDDRDSAIDVSADRQTRSKPDASEEEKDPDQAEHKLQNWILAFFEKETQEYASSPAQEKERSIAEWYSGTTYFFQLDIRDDALVPVRLEESEELQERIKALIPKLCMPRYIRELDLPWYKAEDITVLSEVSDPTPVHPGLVRVNDTELFFKTVDIDQPQPMKREIKLLAKIEKLELGDKIRVPKVMGLVAHENSSTDIMGMLLSKIDAPKPLTTLLSSEVPEDTRLRWADECKDMVKVLHDNGIIWGDAKADNFLVDSEERVWIIDFGGSYTEGWVDEELSETVKGDDMGTEKIVDALIDPDENTFDPEDEDSADEDYVPSGPDCSKRKRIGTDEKEHKKAKKG